MSEIEQLYTEQGKVAEMMQKFGGSFAKPLGVALQHADLINAIKIKACWSDLWAEYLDLYNKFNKGG